MTASNSSNSVPARSRKACSACLVFLALLAGTALQSSGARGQSDALPVQDSLDTAREFVAQVEAFIGKLRLEREASAVRVNACEGRQGESRGDIYYIWVGLRGVAAGGDAADILEEVHTGWLDARWTVTRYRHLPNGGINVAATEPVTGNGFTLDSGFEPDPGGYVVGYFNTPCYRSPSGIVQFGEIRQGLE